MVPLRHHALPPSLVYHLLYSAIVCNIHRQLEVVYTPRGVDVGLYRLSLIIQQLRQLQLPAIQLRGAQGGAEYTNDDKPQPLQCC